MSTTSTLQDDLIEQLRLQEEKYARAASVIENLSNGTSSADPAQQKNIILLQKLLADIRVAANRVDAARMAYEAAGQPKSAELSLALQQQASKLTDFLTRIDSLKASFSSGVSTLQRQLDNQATRRSMHDAYRKSMKTG